jgi:4'-phosphopantetheinyl transferase
MSNVLITLRVMSAKTSPTSPGREPEGSRNTFREPHAEREEYIGLPPCGQPVLVRVAVSEPRSDARREVRAVLREILAAWSHLSPDQVPLEETLRGPVWQGDLCGAPLDISLSYSPNDAWIGLIRGGTIGVDVMRAERFPDADNVARLYLGPAAAERIRQSADPAEAFAQAWTERESRLKCLKQGLTEWTESQAQAESQCQCRNVILGDLVGAVSWRSISPAT